MCFLLVTILLKWIWVYFFNGSSKWLCPSTMLPTYLNDKYVFEIFWATGIMRSCFLYLVVLRTNPFLSGAWLMALPSWTIWLETWNYGSRMNLIWILLVSQYVNLHVSNGSQLYKRNINTIFNCKHLQMCKAATSSKAITIERLTTGGPWELWLSWHSSFCPDKNQVWFLRRLEMKCYSTLRSQSLKSMVLNSGL